VIKMIALNRVLPCLAHKVLYRNNLADSGTC